MKTYTEKEVVKLLADFGTHVAEQCTGKKLEIAGELMKWWKLNIPAVSVSVASSDVGKCTKCKFNINDRCTVGTYYAEQGKSRFCIEGELWEATER